MNPRAALPRTGAVGFTLLLASVVASVWTGDWKWLVVGVAALLAAAVWSATESGGPRG
ncbi:hypothetical protein SAMN05421810_101105 [Amycolatopsis arida]|uniref:Uncharacterized protein n=1 Tax=Amycolatopsis arida TaxID=587909 RepID=A0A1I5KDV1_9PSEU|nr:hypothetical protein [Amycolatopsis arida]TDX97001.1 hypothetical protein CLV69_102103 [Amycolatopsis arida]SFO83224.1 hypothetical protein SAMN05421810_101105 [Amycolatopsis arida]